MSSSSSSLLYPRAACDYLGIYNDGPIIQTNTHFPPVYRQLLDHVYDWLLHEKIANDAAPPGKNGANSTTTQQGSSTTSTTVEGSRGEQDDSLTPDWMSFFLSFGGKYNCTHRFLRSAVGGGSGGSIPTPAMLSETWRTMRDTKQFREREELLRCFSRRRVPTCSIDPSTTSKDPPASSSRNSDSLGGAGASGGDSHSFAGGVPPNKNNYRIVNSPAELERLLLEQRTGESTAKDEWNPELFQTARTVDTPRFVSLMEEWSLKNGGEDVLPTIQRQRGKTTIPSASQEREPNKSLGNKQLPWWVLREQQESTGSSSSTVTPVESAVYPYPAQGGNRGFHLVRHSGRGGGGGYRTRRKQVIESTYRG